MDLQIIHASDNKLKTFRHLILDEAQNTTGEQMKMFLTRIGEDSKVVVNGDISQHDLKSTQSGLQVAIDLMHKHNIPAAHCNFNHDDVVRSGICAAWTRAFS